MKRRTAGLAVASISTAVFVASALPAAAGPTPPPGTTFENTNESQNVVLADPLPNATYTAGAVVQLVGPGAATNTITGTGTGVQGAGTCVATVCTASSISTTLDFVDAGLPAGPGGYMLSVYPGTGVPGVSNPLDETAVTVTGDPPAPSGTAPPVVVQPGHSAPINIVGSGFAKGDTVTSSTAGIAVTVANPQGTAVLLHGTVAVGPSVPVGTYSLTVTDTAAQTGTCLNCLKVQSQPVVPPPKSTALTLTASTSKVTGGKRVKFSGLLTEAGNPLRNQPVKLFGKPDTGKAKAMGTAHTNGQGAYKFSVKPPSSTTYATLFAGHKSTAGAAGDAAALSHAFPHVVVVPVVIANAKKSSSRHKPLTVKGRVKPAEAGQTVYLSAIRGGHHKRLGVAKLSGTSHFRFHLKKPRKRGTYKLVVAIHRQPGHAGAKSKQLTIKRT